MTYTIRLVNCAFFARHGALPEEERLGQRFFVDVELAIEGEGPQTDRVEDTVHYGEVFALVERTVTATRRDLIEALALDVADGVLASFPSVRSVSVTVRKPSVPIHGILDHVSATVTRERA